MYKSVSCIKSININFKTNDIFLILCLKIIIAKREPILPPINDENNKFTSETLFIYLPFLYDCILS